MDRYSGNMATTQIGFDINGNPCPPLPPSGADSTMNGYEDFTGMGPTRFEDTDLYAKSINISEGRNCEDEPEHPANYRQKVCRRVEVPYTRKVKVPVRTTKIVPSMVEMRVPVKKLVQVPCYKVVDEQYTVFEEREAVREKEIWVKQIVPEKYIQRVPVSMTRQVKKQSQEIREVEEMVSVEVPSTQAVEVDGYRIDDVEDTKVVEVEEFEEYEYIPRRTGNSELARTREIGRLPNSRIARNVGTDTYHNEHPDIAGLDLDSNPPPNLNEQNFYGDNGGQPYQYGERNSGYEMPDPTVPNFSNDNFTHSDYIRSAGKSLALHSTNEHMIKKSTGGLGLSVRNTHTRHSDGTGVLVTKVDNGGKAALAGLIEGDIITSINGIETSTVEEFARSLNNGESVLKILFNRDGRKSGYSTIER